MHPIKLFFCFVIILATGCSQQSPKNLAILETTTVNGPFYAQAEREVNKVPRKRAVSVTFPPIAKSASLQRPATVTRTLPSALPKVTQNNLWERLLSLYALPGVDNARVENQLKWYLKHPNYITTIQQRAEPYLFYILEEIEANGLPGELALLPIVESAFKPFAYSSAQAAGLWQFIPATGRLFGLKQNWWYDGRRDIVASTRAATRYLKELHEEFAGDWFLALAAYNAGKGNIRNFMAKNQRKGLKTDYWSLKLYPETMNYVPRLLAIAKIFAHTDRYHVALNQLANEPYFDIIDVGSPIDLYKAMELAQMSAEEFLLLNPGFNQWSTDPSGPHQLLIPRKNAKKFKEKLALLPVKERIKSVRHTVKPGENLHVIADRYETSVIAIKKRNGLKKDLIQVGKVLIVPIPHQTTRQKNPFFTAKEKIYTVKKGDSFWLIAKKFSVNTRDIARWNQLSLKEPLKPGQKLIIRTTGRASIA